MKKILSAMLILALLSGCTTRTQYGKCIGLADQEKPNLEYEISYWNIFMGFIFSETIVVPIVVGAAQLYCPVGKKDRSEIDNDTYIDNNRSNNSGNRNNDRNDNSHPRADGSDVPVTDKSFNKEKMERPVVVTQQKEVIDPVEKDYPAR